MDHDHAHRLDHEPPRTGETEAGAPAKRKGRRPTARRTYQPIPRTVATCNRYLDRLAPVIGRAGKNGAVYLPLVRRLERELAEAQAEEETLARMHARLARMKSPSKPMDVPNL